MVVSQSPFSNSTAITLEQLTALNDEIAALVRSGVPLEEGLSHLGGDLPGRLGRFAAALAARLERGESLADALEDQGAAIPAAYRAVIVAGLSAGRLPAALESIARSSRQLTDLRRLVIAGLVYPLLVFLVAWGLFVFFVVEIAPVFLDAFRGFEAPGQAPLEMLVRWGQSAAWWGPAVPLAVLVLLGAWWFLSRRAAVIDADSAGPMLGWLPWTGRLLRSLRTATVAEILAMLVENDVPLPRSILLAAETVGDAPTRRAAAQLAGALERGEPLPQVRGAGAFSPFLNWLMAAGRSHGALTAALRHAAKVYLRKAERQAEMAQLLLPVLMTLAIGGTAVVMYALLLFVPWMSLLYNLTRL
jgi:general secretion pathway protein F